MRLRRPRSKKGARDGEEAAGVILKLASLMVKSLKDTRHQKEGEGSAERPVFSTPDDKGWGEEIARIECSVERKREHQKRVDSWRSQEGSLTIRITSNPMRPGKANDSVERHQSASLSLPPLCQKRVKP